MAEVSIKIRKNAARGSTTPGECINLWSPLNPEGARGVRYGTVLQGGDGFLEFSTRDRGHQSNWPANKNDAAEVYYGTERITQHSVVAPRPNEMEGALEYACQGHDARMEHAAARQSSVVARTVRDWILYMLHDSSVGWTGSAFAFPFVNSSQRYIDTMLAAENPTLNIGYDITEQDEQIFSDMLKYCDFTRGIFPGRDPRPNTLGCYPYWRHRTRGKTVDWYITQEDLAAIDGGGLKVDLDWSKYTNYVRVHYKDSAGNPQLVNRQDTASQARWTPGSNVRTIIDLSGLDGYLTQTQAEQVGDVYLSIYTEPQPIGSITIPLAMIQRTAGGMQWSGKIRAGEIVKVENDEEYLVYETIADIDAGIIELKLSKEADDAETLMMQSGIQIQRAA
ncbi:MAG: hypothetical protein IBX61_09515 [Thermoleophilia bacterium]|nr:hypothetical protein [Thermoleophilia bacterium]